MYTLADIKKVLPHREPFLMIDRVLECEPGKSAKAIRAVNANEWFFKGHFKDQKVFPGVLLIESMAQTGAFAVLMHPSNKDKNALFRGIRKLKFKRVIIPGDLIEIDVEITNMRPEIGIGKAKAFVDGELAGEGEMIFAFTSMQA